MIGLSFVERLVAATAGFNGYARLGRNPAGGFGFMALILLIAMTISCVWTTVQSTRGLGEVATEMAKAPDFAFRNGQVEFSGQMPFVIDDGEGTLVIIDTTGQTGPEALEGRLNGILLTKNVLYQVQGGRFQETDLSAFPFTFTKDTMIGFVQKLWVFIPIGYAFWFLLQLGFKALDAVILGVVGLIYGGITGKKVDFGLGFKLGLYAMTIPIALQFIIPRFSVNPFNPPIGTVGFLGWWAIAIIYLIFGLQAYFRTPEEPQAPYYPNYPQN